MQSGRSNKGFFKIHVTESLEVLGPATSPTATWPLHPHSHSHGRLKAELYLMFSSVGWSQQKTIICASLW